MLALLSGSDLAHFSLTDTCEPRVILSVNEVLDSRAGEGERFIASYAKGEKEQFLARYGRALYCLLR